MHDTNLLEDQPIAWTPTPDVIERSRLTQFMKQVGASTWDELYEFSIRDVEKFTEEVLKFLDIKFDPPYEKLLDTSSGVELPTWLRRNADAPVRNEGEARTTAATFANKKGWHERGYLPHFDGVVTQFITFRLADSLPQNVLRRIEKELEGEDLPDKSREYRKRVEEYLDRGIGGCILKNVAVAEIVKESLVREHENSCLLIAWVIMPNHVHILLRPLEGHSLSDIVGSIKSVSSHKINSLLGRTGSVWQPDYFDRYIRDADHFGKAVRYIHNNPVKAGLCSSPEEWMFSSAGTRTPSSALSAKPSPQAAIAAEGGRVPAAGLNITTMCLDRWQTDEMKDQPAVIWEAEDGKPGVITYAQLLGEVETCAGVLRRQGFTGGDAIGIHLPMTLLTVVALLAINRIGAIAVPVFSGYGVEAISSRLNAVRAKGLFTTTGFSRRGKDFNALKTATEAVAQCSTIDNVFVVTSGHGEGLDEDKLSSDSVKYIDLIDMLYDFGIYVEEHGDWKDYQRTEPTSAEDPLIILYTSGTTGKPKGIAHTHASFPIKAAQDMAFGTDVGRGTRICWYTDIGWMMGPWLIYGALINGATICIYDGAPDYPTADRMWEFCAKHEVEVLGISPTLVRALAAQEDQRNADAPVRNEGKARRKAPEDKPDDPSSSVRVEATLIADEGVCVPAPYERHDLSSLRAFASTGEPWNPAPWWWLFEKVGNSKIPIINYSGGTEIAGGILMGNPLLPQKPCSFPAPCPGMDVDILDENGEPVGPNQVGELSIKQPWIGMARGFWQEKERYLETYWSRFKNIWVHGDWAMRDGDGHWFILGRSDDTLKVAGKRVGPAEVESLLVAHPNVTEAAVIGIPDEVKGTAMVAFCVLRNADAPVRNEGKARRKAPEDKPVDPSSSVRVEATLIADEGVRVPLEDELKSLVAKDMGKPLAPSKIHFVSALPKTRNAKVMRRVIRAAYLGEDAGDLSALENPAAVDEIRDTNR
jgi:acetyl-CoA synthetase